MAKLLDRPYQPISAERLTTSDGLLVTVHGEAPQGNAVFTPTVQEARILAYGLLAEAERSATRR